MRSRLPYHAHRRWFEWKDWRDILLGQVVERLQSQENAVAVAVMIGEAHGYELQYEVVQVSDGSVWRAGWSEFQRDAPVDLKSSSMECDLIADLSELHAEHPASRVTLPEDSSRGRYMVLFVATMSFKKWITGQTRLSGEPRQGALDRIVDILFGQPASAP